MKIVDENKNTLTADVRIIGVGGGGSNAVENMVKSGIKGVRFIAVNTDAQALSNSNIETKIQLGVKLTKGLGAGANPEIGHRAAIESYDEIAQNLKGADMVFITAGMGGGTGTGGASVIAEIARQQGALTVGIVTRPFLFEGNRRKKHAEKGIEELKTHLDTLIVIPNEKLLSVCDKDTPLTKTFQKTDDILSQAVKGIAELISLKGLINLDFADIKTVMTNKGKAVMGVGIAKGENRAMRAVSNAISSPLLESSSIAGATGVIVNITGGSDLSLSEVNQATTILTEAVDEDADIIVGAVIDKNMRDTLSVTVIVTGFNDSSSQEDTLSKNIKNDLSFVDQNPQEEVTPSHELKSEEIETETESQVESNEAPVNHEDHQNSQIKEDIDKIEFVNAVDTSSSSADSIKNILLSKAEQYKKEQSEKSPEAPDDKQLDMNWEESSVAEESSPFESEVDFIEEDFNS